MQRRRPLRMLRTQFCDTMKTAWAGLGRIAIGRQNTCINSLEQRRRAVGAIAGREDNSVVLVIAMMARQYPRELEAEL